MYCKNCGNQVDEKAVVCIHCGCLTDFGEKINFSPNVQTSIQQEHNQPQNHTISTSNNNTLGTVAKIFMIISCVFMGLYIIPLCWTIPMTISLSNKLKNNEPISTGFKICILLFVNTISGILLLCMKDNN